jgi:hypothetical protein
MDLEGYLTCSQKFATGLHHDSVVYIVPTYENQNNAMF